MQTKELLNIKMREKGYSKTKLQNEVGCCEKNFAKLSQWLNR